MSYVQTYPNLVTNLMTWMSRSSNDTNFTSLIPQFVEFACVRLKRDLRILGFVKVVSGVFTPTQSVLQKPAGWRTTLSLTYGTTNTVSGGIGNYREPIFKRDYDWCRAYWPDDSITGAPKFYGDYDYTNFLIVPTPDLAYAFELIYLEMPLAIDDTHQTNWMTIYIPNVLFYATAIEACAYVQNAYKQAIAQDMYDKCVQAILSEDAAQKTDRQDDISKD